ncbi:MAG TPA: hypothetical protein VFR09_07585, partial [Alphaproteobacteria bacterium]|nr:hypothetical protein [Alphaproteobacteria bacterium]
MKKISVSVLALAAVLAAPVAHADSIPGWYVGAGAGATFTPDGVTNTPGADHNNLIYGTGWNIN